MTKDLNPHKKAMRDLYKVISSEKPCKLPLFIFYDEAELDTFLAGITPAFSLTKNRSEKKPWNWSIPEGMSGSTIIKPY